MNIRFLLKTLPFAALMLALPTLGQEHDHAAHEGHSHAEGEGCGHDHAADAHEGHSHAEGECCGHDHAADAHAGHSHAEGECCGHDHAADAHEGHNHAEGEGCGHDHAADTHAGHSHDGVPCTGDHGSGAGEAVIVTADPHSRHLIALRVEEVPEPEGALVTSLYGTLAAPDHALHTYALPAAGRITLHVKSAEQVQAGALLYTVESPALSDQVAAIRQIEANVARCGDELAALTARVERLNTVGTRNSDLEEQLTFKRAEERQLARDLDTAKARLRMLALGAEIQEKDGLPYLLVKAAKPGTVRNVGVPQGSWGEQGAAVITMSDLQALEIVASLYANDMPSFDSVRATIPQGRENTDIEGTWRLAEQVHPQKQTRTLYFSPAELPKGARPGQLCRLDLYDSHAACGDDHADCGNTVPVPDSAIVRVGMDDMVFVELEPGRYAAVKVRAGESRRGMTPVTGLKPGQRIVVKGGYELKYILPGDGQQKKAGHFHADGKFHEGEHH